MIISDNLPLQSTNDCMHVVIWMRYLVPLPGDKWALPLPICASSRMRCNFHRVSCMRREQWQPSYPSFYSASVESSIFTISFGSVNKFNSGNGNIRNTLVCTLIVELDAKIWLYQSPSVQRYLDMVQKNSRSLVLCQFHHLTSLIKTKVSFWQHQSILLMWSSSYGISFEAKYIAINRPTHWISRRRSSHSKFLTTM